MTCPYCEDSGIVELAGTTRIHNINYSRGSTPCRWCERGINLFQSLETKHENPLSRYDETDLAAEPDLNYHYLPKKDASRLIREVLTGMHRINVDEMDSETRRLVTLQIEARERNYAPKPRRLAALPTIKELP